MAKIERKKTIVVRRKLNENNQKSSFVSTLITSPKHTHIR